VAEDKINPAWHAESLDASIVRALKTAPRFEIPSDFAARVARQLPPQPAAILSPARYGYRAAVACLVVLLALILALAPRGTGTSIFWILIESTFCAQFALVAVWLAVRNAGYTFASLF
jgi:hypothetical protein